MSQLEAIIDREYRRMPEEGADAFELERWQGKAATSSVFGDVEAFRTAIEKFIGEHKMTPTRFGKQFTGDPLFVSQLRDGRKPSSDTRARITRAMDDWAAKKALEAAE